MEVRHLLPAGGTIKGKVLLRTNIPEEPTVCVPFMAIAKGSRLRAGDASEG